jgi:membrane protein DedA with SNARE-associated domain/rhodanese-related sulfurtransferase
MTDAAQFLSQYGVLAIFVVVFLKQLGPPLPAFPLLLIAGAAAVAGDINPISALVAAVLGSVLADTLWYSLGRRYGYAILRLLCRVSLNPDSCVRQSETTLVRWGSASLIAGKFIPGFSSVAAPLAGAIGMSISKFTLANFAGASVYAVFCIGLGALFNQQVEAIVNWLTINLQRGVFIIGIALAIFLLYKYLLRRKFLREIESIKITPPDFHKLLQGNRTPIVLDVRSATGRQSDRRSIPGAVPFDAQDEVQIESLRRDENIGRDIVVFCACPNDASAARIAQRLTALGLHARPLAGGIDGWAEFERARRQDVAAAVVTS